MNISNLVRSGWWVVVAAVGVTGMVALTLLRSPGDWTRDEATPVFDLKPSLVDQSFIVHAMAQDGLKALTDPELMSPIEVDRYNEAERGKLLVASDLVIGVEIDGEARAYPLRLLRWHEAVNDVVGGRAIAITYCPLSGGIAVWNRSLNGVEIEFAVSGRLLNSNTLLYDRRSDGARSSLWHQLTGEALTGPAAGDRLEPLPAALQTWGAWRSDHPHTLVMAPDEGTKARYKRDPYHSYRGSDVLRFPVKPLAPTGALTLKDMVAVVTVDDRNVVFALPYLGLAVGETAGTWAALLGEDVYLIDFDTGAGTFDIAPREPEVEPPPVRFSYWFQWYALYPTAVPLP